MNRFIYPLLVLWLKFSAIFAQSPVLVKDIATGASSGIEHVDSKYFVNANGILFFVADDGVNGLELWRSDGTSSGTYMVKDINPGRAQSTPTDLTYMNGIVYFVANDGRNGSELWRSDGTSAGTYMVIDINPNAVGSFTGSFSLINVNGTLYFQASHPTYGYSLWRSNGTASGTTYITNGAGDTRNTSLLREMEAVNGKLFFVMKGSSPSAVGYELWRIDSPTSSPALVKDINPGLADSSPYKLTSVNNLLFFVANNGTQGFELWRSDGTATGTFIAKELYAGNNTNNGDFLDDLTNVDGFLFFFNLGTPETNNTQSLWRSDGTSAGTNLIKYIPRGYTTTSYPCSVNGLFYFVPAGSEANGGGQVWRSDGSLNGTYLVKKVSPSSVDASAKSLTNVKDLLYFESYPGPLWRSDGTADGTTPIFPTGVSEPYYLNNFIPTNDKLFFTAVNSANGRELWVLPLTSQLVCQSLQSGSWASSATWSCGHIPTIYDQVIITSGHTVTISNSNAQAKRVSYLGNGKILFNAGASKVFVKGN